MVGRVEQRLGAPEALEHLQQVVELEPALSAARIALAEARSDEGQRGGPSRFSDGVLARDSDICAQPSGRAS